MSTHDISSQTGAALIELLQDSPLDDVEMDHPPFIGPIRAPVDFESPDQSPEALTRMDDDAVSGNEACK